MSAYGVDGGHAGETRTPGCLAPEGVLAAAMIPTWGH